jgi:3-oxoacyl-(acyl-carrier-protein) synthase
MSQVVVTGVGAVTPLGVGIDAFWGAALAGHIGTGELTRIDTSGCVCKRGGEVKDFEPADFLKRLQPRALPRVAQFAAAATRMALTNAGLLDPSRARGRVGICFGSVLSERPALEARARELYSHRGGRWAAGDRVPFLSPTLVTRAPALEMDLNGPNLTVLTACAAGNTAITFAADVIRSGAADAMVAGGADELSCAMFMMFSSVQALAPDVVRPFARNRKGLLLSEGAAALVLETADRAISRGATVYGEVCGHGDFNDAHHMTAPHPEGRGAIHSLERALRHSDLRPDQVDYVCAHGTGTPLNDAVEARALSRVFGSDAEVPVSSVKSMVGHTQGAAGALGAICCLLAIRDGVIPPNMNYDEPDPKCPLNIVANAPLRRRVDVALNNAFGFGGSTSTLILKRYHERGDAP